MKKITLFVLALFAIHFNYAQDTCATAIAVTAGTTSVGTVNGTADNTCGWTTAATTGEWYSYTPSSSNYVTLSSNLAVNDGITNSDDTRVSILTGACGTLSCLAGSDDVSDTNYLTELGFYAVSGETYYILWDDRWSDAPFDFTLTEDIPDCTSVSSFPYTEDWSIPNYACWTTENANGDDLEWTYNDVNDFDADGTDDNIVNIFPQAAGVAKDDWLFSPAISGVAGNDYTINLIYNVLDQNATANESLEIVILNAPASTATSQNIIGTYNNITQMGAFGVDFITAAYTSSPTYTPSSTEDFYVGIHLTTAAADSDIFVVFGMSIDSTLGVNEFNQNTFTHNYNNQTEILSLESSNFAMTKIEIYSLLGQSVISQSLSNSSESIDVSTLNDGVYLARVSVNGNSKTIKFIKH